MEGSKIYFQIAWTPGEGELICRMTDPNTGQILTTIDNTYHGTYAQCNYFTLSKNGESVWPIELELNGVVYPTDEITAMANGPFRGKNVGYIKKMKVYKSIQIHLILYNDYRLTD